MLVKYLIGELPDQAALYGVLNRLRDLNLTLWRCGEGMNQDTPQTFTRRWNNFPQDIGTIVTEGR